MKKREETRERGTGERIKRENKRENRESEKIYREKKEEREKVCVCVCVCMCVCVRMPVCGQRCEVMLKSEDATQFIKFNKLKSTAKTFTVYSRVDSLGVWVSCELPSSN